MTVATLEKLQEIKILRRDIKHLEIITFKLMINIMMNMIDTIAMQLGIKLTHDPE